MFFSLRERKRSENNEDLRTDKGPQQQTTKTKPNEEGTLGKLFSKGTICVVAAIILFCILVSTMLSWKMGKPLWSHDPDPITHGITNHFYSAISEISDSIPRLDRIKASNNNYDQFGFKRRKEEVMESLEAIRRIGGIPQLNPQILLLEELMGKLNSRTDSAEKSFIDAFHKIEITTEFLMIELPFLNLSLQEGQICFALGHLSNMIKAIADLLKELEAAKVPMKYIKIDINQLIKEIGFFQNTLTFLLDPTDSLVSNDRKDELTKNMEVMQSSSQFIDQSLKSSEIKILVVLEHLQNTRTKIAKIHSDVGASEVQFEGRRIEVAKITRFTDVCKEKFWLSNEQKEKLKTVGDQTLLKFQQIREQNESFLRAISVLGYAAIQVYQEQPNQ
eukprot:TRINITY_DN2660_c0_g4_i1.p1 TRINITY_DN2660_c0_g4~~TRINITY_DN2660_c0_g4_i1.p1  ORF type:complete len:390 (-),score=86.03 TRINITY_DN2660_c0_g4_i1:69-1238(-)